MPCSVNVVTGIKEPAEEGEEELIGINDLLGEDPGEGISRSANQVLKKRQRPAPTQYYFPVSHKETKLGNLPPLPCKVCSSPKHWDKECLYWDKYLEKLKARSAQIAALQVHPNASPEEAYQAMYQASVLEMAKEMVQSEEEQAEAPQGFHTAS